MTMKVDLNMNLGRASWTETHYYLASSDFLTAAAAAATLANARSQLLGVGATMGPLRISDVPANRNVDDVQYNHGTGSWPADPTGLLYAAQHPNVALLVRLQGPTQNKLLYLGGCPNKIFNQPGGSVPGVTFDGVFNPPFFAYMGLLTNSGGSPGSSPWGFRARNSTGELSATSLVQNAAYPGMIGVVTQSPPTWSQGQEVWLTGWRRINTGLPGLSGGWVVGGILAPVPPATGPWTTFLANSGGVSTTNFRAPGQINGLNYSYVPYETYAVLKAVTRKRGGSYGAPRGRSRARR